MRKSLESSTYHSLLRVALLVCAFTLVFDIGLLNEATQKLSLNAQQYVAAAVGVRVGVAQNDVNVLTARITELETELARKEREIDVNVDKTASPAGPNTSTFVLSAILFILLVLIVLNYVLDYLRSRRETLPRTVRVS